jgi:hypothetical protein
MFPFGQSSHLQATAKIAVWHGNSCQSGKWTADLAASCDRKIKTWFVCLKTGTRSPGDDEIAELGRPL